MKNSTDIGKLILRLAVAGLMLFHGISKAQHGIDWVKPMLDIKHIPSFVGYGLFVAEIIAPILIIIGLWTRLASLTIVIDMVMIFVLGVKPVLDRNPMSGSLVSETELFFLFAALSLVFMGGGKFGVTGGKGKWD